MVHGQGDPHRARRHDVARGGRGARHGQALRRGRARRSRWTSEPALLHGERALDRAKATGSRWTAAPAGSTPARRALIAPSLERRLRPAHGLGRRGPAPPGPGQCRHAGRRARGPGFRRRGDRALPHRAHVLRGRADPRHARDDPRRRRGRAGSARSTSCCRCSAATSRESSARWKASRSPSGCSTRRCTNSSPRTPRKSTRLAREMGRTAEGHRAHGRRACSEVNPMLGLRGCRLGIIYPEITGCRPAPSSRRPAPWPGARDGCSPR